MFKLLDLFSGIGGFSLGLEKSQAFTTVAFCERDEHCQKVLRKHWPNVPIYDDIKSLTGTRLVSDGINIDAICGGFPCQDISEAGNKAGIAGTRSGLWGDFARIISEIRPKYVFVENVSDLLIRGLDVVLSDLAKIGYDAEWHCIQARDVGAPHIRDRIWIIAYPSSDRQPSDKNEEQRERSPELLNGRRLFTRKIKPKHEIWRPTEPYIRRVAYGVPGGSHRLRMLGNAVVPAIPEILGEAVKYAEINKKR